MAEARLEPGTATQPHYHRRSEEISYILRGQGLMRIGSEGENLDVGSPRP